LCASPRRPPPTSLCDVRVRVRVRCACACACAVGGVRCACAGCVCAVVPCAVVRQPCIQRISAGVLTKTGSFQEPGARRMHIGDVGARRGGQRNDAPPEGHVVPPGGHLARNFERVPVVHVRGTRCTHIPTHTTHTAQH